MANPIEPFVFVPEHYFDTVAALPPDELTALMVGLFQRQTES